MGKVARSCCLDGDGDGQRCDWQTPTEDLLFAAPGTLRRSLCLRQLATVLLLYWRLASLTILGLTSPRENFLSVSCGGKMTD